MKDEPKIYGVYLCESFRKGGEIHLADLRPLRLEDEGKEGQTKTVKIYQFEADIMNNGVGRAPKWSVAAKKDNPVYLTKEEFKEITGKDDESFPVVEEKKPATAEEKEEPKRGRPKKETKTEK